MLKIEEIKSLIETIDASSINEFTYEVDGAKVKLKKQVEQQVVQPSQSTPVKQPVVDQIQENVSTTQEVNAVQNQPIQVAAGDYEITSPMVGTFYSSSSPDQDAFVSVGDKIGPDTVVCIVEAMKLFNEIEAEVTGEIVEILVENGELVEYGQPLFRVKTK
ncbi:Biotin carboxyl carrier protein of acetyl-CoA carboxylase [Paraliobacillus sp. PM-2]|uniref:acetyl-CoA carboxylase biotin carboxyl carrier protein n=1 Tax=Paraliobacillus sp. PM-2 TaxID=1462524 RepID=UPI00061CA85A|nr:acetyl-CoA carboxylase biotin carboxyl carrier protein [Paraliobacillus sp. PM-2]CQR46789.1 Biotin carboxyl carrier protein of acetyl-CoA carboxylase [Paraliobacillus sp. PM-2]